MLSPRIVPESVDKLVPVGTVHSWRKKPVRIKLGYHYTTILLCKWVVNIWSIREKYLSLITDIAMECEALLDIQRKRDALVDELRDVYANSPSTSEAAYKKAHKALNLHEEMTFSVAEVDSFLPQALRRTE